MLVTTIFATLILSSQGKPAQAAPGQLTIIQKDGKAGNLCPLERTSVNATISGFGARVNVTQTFTNPTNEPIEAIYTFPLPADSAVDRMQMQIGTRVIEAEIKRREEARRMYEEAKTAGKATALLNQERPNVFTQSVANIMPGSKIRVTISYAQILKFEDGEFEFNFPMVVGPRFTKNAPDPDKIAPPTVPETTRSGAGIDITLDLDAGAPIREFHSVLHKINVSRKGDSEAQIKLARADEIPNKDFILRYRTSTDTVQSAFITHMGEKGGFFTLILMPPKAPKVEQIARKEIIFVMDQSGSQNGFPLQKSKELTLKMIKSLFPGDTFNVIGFNEGINVLWSASRPNTPANIAEAQAFVSKMEANGGTDICPGVVAALKAQDDPQRLRVVVFNTDGLVGDEAKILDTIQKQRDQARMFTFGIGNSVNRYLIGQMAAEGKGDVEYVTLASDADKAVARFIARTRAPILTDVSATFKGVDVEDALPREIPDVFSEKPVTITGRYRAAGKGRITLTGKLGNKPWSKTIDLDFPSQASAPALESLWARQRVDELMRQNFLASAYPKAHKVTVEEITRVALDYRIMTEFTSFVAVEKKVVNVGGKQKTVSVPVDKADGVNDTGQDIAEMSRKTRSYGGAPGGAGGANAQGLQFKGGGSAALAPPAISTSSPTAAKRGTVLGGTAKGTFARKSNPGDEDKSDFRDKIAKELKTAKGAVQVEVWFAELDAAAIKKLKKLGFKVIRSDKGLGVVIGSCDAKLLMAIAQMEDVNRIKKL